MEQEVKTPTQQLNTTLGKRALNFYGISDFAFAFVANIENFFWMYYLTNVAQYPLVGLGLANSIAYAADSFCQPIYAGLISALKPMRWGKNSSYMIVYSPLVMITFILCYTKIGGDTIGLFIVGFAMWATNGTRTMTWTSNLNMMNVLSLGNRDNRVMLASRRATWSAASGLIYSYGVLNLINYLEQNLPPTISYAIMAGLTTGLYMIANCFSALWANKGYEYTGEAAKEEGKKEMNVISLPDLVKSVLQNPPLLTILTGAIISSCFTSASATGTTYNFRYIFDYSWYPIQTLTGSIIGTFGSFFAGWAGKTFGTRNSVLMAQLGGIICNITIALFFAYDNPLMCIVIMGIARVFTSFSGANMQALYGDCVTYARWKFGKDTSAMVIGSQTIPVKLGLTLRGVTVPLILSLTNFTPDPNMNQTNAPMELKRGIVIMTRWLPACGSFIYMCILFFGFRMLNDERMEQMQKEIDEREAAAKEAEAAAAAGSD